MNLDVAIVGAGPAGSTLALILARRGLSVALIERDTFPRDKLCGEFLSYDATPILEVLGIRFNAPAITRCRVLSRHHTYEFDFPAPALGVSRLLLDDQLFQTARSAGAHDFSGWTATTLHPLVMEKDGQRVNLHSRVIVGAWGRWGRFDSQLKRRFARDHSHRHFGFKRHYQEPDPQPGPSIDLYSFRSGYLGVSPIEGGLTNICGLVHASRLAGLKGGWDAFVEGLRREETGLDELYARYHPAQQGFLSSEPVIFRARSPVESGLYMIGDASGIVDPLTGNGMSMAIQSAAVALPHILRAVQGTGDEAAYVHAHKRFFDRRIRWSRRAAAVLSRPHLLDPLLGAIRSPRPGRFLLRQTRASLDDAKRLAGTLLIQ